MKKEQAKAFLTALGLKASTTARAGWVICPCPFAPYRHERGVDRNPSFGLKVHAAKASFGYCFSCDWSGDLEDMLLELRGHHYDAAKLKAAREIFRAEEDELPLTLGLEDEGEAPRETRIIPDQVFASFPPLSVAPEARAYLSKRKGGPITLAAQIALEMRWDIKRKRIVVPIRDPLGALVGMQGRAIDEENEPKYLFYPYKGHVNSILWLGAHWLDLDEPVVLVEGFMDVARVLEIYPNVCAALGANLKGEKLDFIAGAREIINLLDADKTGNRTSLELLRRCKSAVIHRPELEAKDPCDAGAALLKELLGEFIKMPLGKD